MMASETPQGGGSIALLNSFGSNQKAENAPVFDYCCDWMLLGFGILKGLQVFLNLVENGSSERNWINQTRKLPWRFRSVNHNRIALRECGEADIAGELRTVRVFERKRRLMQDAVAKCLPKRTRSSRIAESWK